MLFLERGARALSIIHLVAAAVLVAASTHHLIWCRGFLRGRFARVRGERRFVAVTAIAFLATFALGNLLYPTYKVRVRAEYLDSPQAVEAELAARKSDADRAGTPPPKTPPVADLSWAGRLFDVKEHWAALGLACALALWALSRFAHPSEDARTLPLYLGLSVAVCGIAWLGAIVGAVLATIRSVGGAA